jgi:hypothetical protein
MNAVTRKPVQPHEIIFRDLSSNSESKTVRQLATLRQMLDRFKKALISAKRSEGTLRTYEVPARILCDVLGENRSLDSISREDMEELFALLRRVPANAKTKRKYKNLNIQQAIDAADKCGDSHRLRSKTLANYFNNIVAIFNFAVAKQLIKENPASDRWLRASFTEDGEDSPKALFDVEEMNRLFRAPLYTGCRDDGRNYAKPGPNKPRGGRFGVPLLTLFHGFPKVVKLPHCRVYRRHSRRGNIWRSLKHTSSGLDQTSSLLSSKGNSTRQTSASRKSTKPF